MIENYIPVGYKRRVSRKYLSAVSGIKDRKVRLAIAAARERGEVILSAGGGYFKYGGPEDDPYFLDYDRREDHRFMQLSHNRKVRKAAWDKYHPHQKKDKSQVPGQMSMFEE